MTYDWNTQRVMDALVAEANKEGIVDNLSFPQIAHFSGVGLRSVPRHIEALEKAGAIKVSHVRGRGIRNVYEITDSKDGGTNAG